MDLVSKNKCLICNKKLEREDNSSIKRKWAKQHDFICRNDSKHFFAMRRMGETVVKLKFRIEDDDESNIFVQLNYDQSFTEIWKKDSNKIKIESFPSLDFSDIEKLKKKIKTYLVFY